MPTVNVLRDELFAALGESFTDDQFTDLCFQFGIELDDVTTEEAMRRKERGDTPAESTKHSSDVIYKIEVPANRYDLLCVEGLSRALQIFRKRIPVPQYTVHRPSDSAPTRVIVKPETAQIRPFIVSAILRNVTFTEASYNNFIDLQDKLHQNICRKRTLVAIGTHDLDTLQGPFTYEALPPKDIKFAPLNKTQEFTAEELMEVYKSDMKLKAFLHIINWSPVFPVIYDAKRTVLSLPPIINGNHSRITLSTRNVFIECTATDLTKAHVVLNIVVTMFSQYCKEPFTTESVEIVMPDGTRSTCPDLSERELITDISYLQEGLAGYPLPPADVADCLYRMQLPTKILSDNTTVHVRVPPTRADVLHACDVMEDLAIAYGFDLVGESVPPTLTIGKQLPLNKLSDLLRAELAMAGFLEILSMALVSHEDNFQFLNRPDSNKTAVSIANPRTIEFEEVRTTLLSGLLKTVNSNRGAALPMNIFEVSDVVLLDSTADVGARNRRCLAALHTNTNSSGLEIIHGLLDRLMLLLNVPLDREKGYSIAPSKNPTFFPGRSADIFFKGDCIGVFGVVHPEVIKSYKLVYPASAMELEIERFV
mmetsp:Transcript_9805/g.16096  ORF Transcript_9805/g.16096 Transcript_9805/m.16096 type:complete len:594 (-) Transcript_9805:539-2320(-)|eukprot:CAMPEP_0184648812 /NCGR_PEP_ID=MMETSP0308-20130426/6041_1 /TAXON_ID=38269 /ORGANISM="Gloeochaete witrockiana, Strain SAG 46.84" /LENGTH=593 /DNA_ID=CAMNT_0027081013 /DNA_START=45 /DNA_END=1826 /DNA_ORIENTATION=+